MVGALLCGLLIGNGLISVLSTDYIWEGVQSAIMRKEPYALTYRIRCENGEVKWVLEKGTGIFTDSGELLGIEGLILETAPPSSALWSRE